MIRSFVRRGNSSALLFDRGILDSARIDPTRPVEITIDGNRLIISQAENTERRKRFLKTLSDVNKTHGRTLKRLGE